jgi:hypothetical protein
MKKFFVVSLVALVCLGLTLPAVAKVKVGGMITQDVMYFNQNNDRVRSQTAFGGGGVPTFPVAAVNPESNFSVLDIGLPQALNRLNVAYSNDDNTIRGFIEVRGGSGFGADSVNFFGNVKRDGNPGNVLVWNYAWIDWVLSPKDFLRFGRQTQAFSIRAPNQFLGQNRGHIVGINFGNMNGGTSRDGVRWFHRFTDQVRFELAVYDPDNDGAEPIGGFSPQIIGGAAATVLEENVWPRVDLTLPLFFGNFSMWPSFTYTKQQYDQVGPGKEDSIDIWGLSFAAQYVWGPLSFNGEITFGDNLGAGNYVGDAIAVPAGYALAPGGNAYINDADVTCWWFDLGWKIGPATLHGIIGNNRVKRGDDPTPGGTNLDRSLWMYGISVPISVAKGFTIRPEMMYYDWDTNANIGNTTTRDFGKEYVIGVQFQLVF